MTVNRQAWDELLTPVAREIFVDNYEELPAQYPKVFDVDTSGRAFEEELVATGLPIAIEKPEGEPIPFDRPRFRGKVRYVHAEYGLGYEVTQTAMEDNLYPAITREGSMNLARSMRETEEIVAHAVINNGFSTTLTYDGVPLFSTAHTGIGGLTFENRPNPDADLSSTALQNALVTYKKMQTDRGLRIQMRPRILFTPVENHWVALEILQTQQVTLTGHVESTEGKNVLTNAGLMPEESPYLTDPDSWFLGPANVKNSNKMKFFWRRRPEDVSGFEKRTGITWYGITARFTAGIADWRGWFGSPGA